MLANNSIDNLFNGRDKVPMKCRLCCHTWEWNREQYETIENCPNCDCIVIEESE